MKVVLKGAGKNEKIEKFFMENVFPILEFGIAFEWTDRTIAVYEKDSDGQADVYFDPTAEVVVELSERALGMALDENVSEEELRKESGKFFDEAQAIRKIQELKRDFSVEYYSCRYSPPSK